MSTKNKISFLSKFKKNKKWNYHLKKYSKQQKNNSLN